MSSPDTITYRGRQYIRVEALSLEDLKKHATTLHDLAQMLRPSIASSDAAQNIGAIQNALTSLVRANSLLMDEASGLPNSVPGDSERIYALASNAADAVSTLSGRLQSLAAKLGKWALRITEHVKEKEYQRSLDPSTQVKKPEESRHFKHLF